MSSQKELELIPIRPDDIIIAVLGITGSGKSEFVSSLVGFDAGIGHNLHSFTDSVRIHTFNHGNNQKVYLVDTPGFNNGSRPDAEVLKDLVFFFAQLHKAGARLTGIIKTHKIDDNRVLMSTKRYLRTLEGLCGPEAFGRIVHVLTMCNNVSQDDVDRRETELRQTPEFLGNMHQHGSCIVRFDGSKRAAAHCIDLIVRKANGGPPVVYKIQQEMEIERRSLWDTSAANPLSTELKWQQTEATRELADLRECEKREKDTQVAESFAHERRTLENKLLVANKGIKDLRVETKSIFDGREVECKERLKAAMQETRALEKELVDDENRRCRLQSFAGMGSKIASLQAAMKSKEKRLLAKRNIIPMLQVLGGLGCIISGATLGAPPFIVGGAALLGSGLGSLSRSLTEEKPKKREAAEKTMLAGKDGLGSHFN